MILIILLNKELNQRLNTDNLYPYSVVDAIEANVDLSIVNLLLLVSSTENV